MKKQKISLAQARSAKVKWIDGHTVELTVWNLVDGTGISIIIPVSQLGFKLEDCVVTDISAVNTEETGKESNNG